MKKRILIILLVILFLLLYMYGLNKCKYKTDSDIKNSIFELVKNNEKILIEAVNTGNYEDVYKIKEIKDITVNEDCVVFYCMGRGIAPSSQEYGFYYSKNSLPIAIFDGRPVHYFKNDINIGKGREYVDNTYNSFYTAKISENFYYYDNDL